MAKLFSSFPVQTDVHHRFAVTEFEPLLDSAQAANLLRIHRKTLHKMARRGEIHGTHVGKLWRFRASDLDDWFHRRGHER